MNETRYLIIAATFLTEADEDTGEPVPPIAADPWRWLYGDSAPFLPPVAEFWSQAFEDAYEEEDEYGLGFPVYEFLHAGEVPAAEWETFAAAYGYQTEHSEPNLGILTEFGSMPAYRWSDGGEAWNVGGWSPILQVTVSLSATEAEVLADPGHFGFITESETA